MNTAATHPGPEEIMGLFDHELAPEEIPSISGHLAACPQCKTLTAELEGVSSRLSAWSVASTTVDARSIGIGEFASGRARSARRSTVPFIRTPLVLPPRWGLGIVGLAIAASAVTFFGLMTGTKTMRVAETGKNQLYSTRAIPMVPATPQDNAAFGHGSGSAIAIASPEVPTNTTSREEPPAPLTQSPMIARSVSLSIMVKDFRAARTALDDTLTRHHAYAADLKASTAENAPRVLVAFLRVPANDLTGTLAELKALGRVQEETQNGEEVTQQHADLVARLKNSRETEQRLQAILTGRTGKMSDVLEVEQEISRVRGEIEQMEAELKNLNHRVAFASVNVTLNEEYQASFGIPPLSVATRLRNALVSGFHNAGETLLGILLFFAEYSLTLAIWLSIFILPVYWLCRRYRRSLASI